MTRWPEVETERQSALLLRVDLDERRLRAAGEHAQVVNLLLRVAAAACLLNREKQAEELTERAIGRLGEWLEATSPARLGDVAACRGMLALSFGAPDLADRVARAWLALPPISPPGASANTSAAAALFLANDDAATAALRSFDLSDAGLGIPWHTFAQALLAKDAPLAQKAASRWLQEKMEATHTNEWGGYNEVPIEVSGALALAERRGLAVRLASNRVFTRFRA
jgi:hypothetical protein